MKTLLLIALLALAVAVPADAVTHPTLTGTVGPGFTITLKKGTAKVATLKAGTYNIVINDKSNIHNFHLMGPKGYSKVLSGIGYVGQKKYTGKTAIKLTPGKWRYVCDPHALTMKGSFTVTR
jgi:plastocyanin